MSIESRVSGHWTDDELIEHIYGVSPSNRHIESCGHCQARAALMGTNRQRVEDSQSSGDHVSFEFLAAQRRKIHAALTERNFWWSDLRFKHWASAATTLLLIAGGLLVFEEHSVQQQHVTTTISDAQLSLEISRMAQDSEPSPTAPLEALFQE